MPCFCCEFAVLLQTRNSQLYIFRICTSCVLNVIYTLCLPLSDAPLLLQIRNMPMELGPLTADDITDTFLVYKMENAEDPMAELKEMAHRCVQTHDCASSSVSTCAAIGC